MIATLTMARVDPETGNHPPDQVYPDGNRAILPPSSYSEAPPVGYCRSAHAPPPQSQGHASGSRSPSDARVCDAECDALQHYNTQVVHPRQQQLLIPNTGSSLARGGGRGGCWGPDQVRQDSSDYFWIFLIYFDVCWFQAPPLAGSNVYINCKNGTESVEVRPSSEEPANEMISRFWSGREKKVDLDLDCLLDFSEHGVFACQWWINASDCENQMVLFDRPIGWVGKNAVEVERLTKFLEAGTRSWNQKDRTWNWD